MTVYRTTMFVFVKMGATTSGLFVYVDLIMRDFVTQCMIIAECLFAFFVYFFSPIALCGVQTGPPVHCSAVKCVSVQI